MVTLRTHQPFPAGRIQPRPSGALRFGLVLFFLLTALPATAAAAPAREDDFDDVIAKAHSMMRKREYDEALKYFKRANGMKGKNCAECLWGMAQAYSRLGAHKNVLETCDQLVQAAAGDRETAARAYNLKGLTLSSMAMENPDKPDARRLAEAEASFRRVLESDAGFEMAHYNLGVTLIRLNKEAEGIGELKTFVEDVDEDEDTAKEARKMIENPRRARENYAPDFSITSTQGEYISSEDLRGKVVLLDFWGTWCPPCVASVPSLARLNKRFAKNPFMLISVSSDNDAGTWRAFIEKNKMIWPQFLDSTDKVQRAFQVRSFPTYVLVDHEGIIRHRSSGYNDYVEGMIEGSVKKALKTLAKAPPTKPAEPSAGAQTVAAPPQAANAAPRNSVPVETARAEKPEPAPQKEFAPGLPSPELIVLGGEEMQLGSTRMNRYPLQIKNWSALPEELFAAAKDLPPCGMGAYATRAELTIWSENGQRLVTYCDLPRPEVLERIWLILPANETPPERIFVLLKDRRSGETIRSNIVALPEVKRAQPTR